jgi:DNA-binding CsgD family transcriptional regulator
MVDLPSRDFRMLMESAAVLAEVEDPARLPKVVLGQIRRLVACDIASHNEVDLRQGRVRVLHDAPDLSNDHLVATFARLAGQNPLVAHSERTGDGAPVMFSDFLTARELRAREIYTDLYQPLGIEHQLACSLTNQPVVVGIALSRSGRDFTERDRAVLELLRPHLAAAHRRTRAHTRLPSVIDGEERFAGLTAREREVTMLVAAGMTNAEIATALTVSGKTVNAHLERIYKKLGVHRRTQLALLVAARTVASESAHEDTRQAPNHHR